MGQGAKRKKNSLTVRLHREVMALVDEKWGTGPQDTYERTAKNPTRTDEASAAIWYYLKLVRKERKKAREQFQSWLLAQRKKRKKLAALALQEQFPETPGERQPDRKRKTGGKDGSS